MQRLSEPIISEVDQLTDLPARAEAERDRLSASLRQLRAQEKRQTTERDRLTRELDEVTRTRSRLEQKAEQVWIEPPARRHPSDHRVIVPHWEADLSTLPEHRRVEYSQLSETIEDLTSKVDEANKKLHSTQIDLERVEQALALTDNWLDAYPSLVGPGVEAAAERYAASEEYARLETELAAAKVRRDQADKTWDGYEHRIIKAGGKSYLRDILNAAQQQKAD